MSDLPETANDPSTSGLLPARIPPGALIPGLLGLLPFWGLALCTVVDTGLNAVLAVVALVMYGAIILSFVGALWWGIAVHAPATAPRNLMFVWSVIPALIGWSATLVSPETGLRMLMSGLALQWLLDNMLMRQVPGLIPRWVFRLRTILTLGAVSPLALTWWQLVAAPAV